MKMLSVMCLCVLSGPVVVGCSTSPSAETSQSLDTMPPPVVRVDSSLVLPAGEEAAITWAPGDWAYARNDAGPTAVSDVADEALLLSIRDRQRTTSTGRIRENSTTDVRVQRRFGP